MRSCAPDTSCIFNQSISFFFSYISLSSSVSPSLSASCHFSMSCNCLLPPLSLCFLLEPPQSVFICLVSCLLSRSISGRGIVHISVCCPSSALPLSLRCRFVYLCSNHRAPSVFMLPRLVSFVTSLKAGVGCPAPFD